MAWLPNVPIVLSIAVEYFPKALPEMSLLLAILQMVVQNAFALYSCCRFLSALRKTSYVKLCIESFISYICERLSTRLNSKMRVQMQKSFKRFQYGKMRSSHPHPEAARDRNAATESMHSAVSAMGKQSYVISPSAREKEYAGKRLFYTAADLTQRFREDPIEEDSVIVMTDVDYYADMDFIISSLKPVFLYTFSPEKAAGPVAEGYYTINNNKVKYRVSGGKTVEHKIWDYSQDHIVTTFRSQTVFGAVLDAFFALFGYNSFAYVVSTVDTWRTMEHRRVVSIVPSVVIPCFLAKFYAGQHLKRVKYSNAIGFNAMVVYGGEAPMISISKEGELACATLPLAELESLATAHKHVNQKHLSDTARRSKLSFCESAVVHSYLMADSVAPTEQYIAGEAVHYTVVTDSVKPEDLVRDEKTYGRRYASAPLGKCEAAFPYESPENSRSSIDGRVTKPQASQKSVSTLYAQYAKEFVKLVVPRDLIGTGTPMDVSEVDDLQKKPLQRVRSAQRLWDVVEFFRVKAFQKREAYPAPSEPRNISSCPTMHTLKLSCYTLQFKQAVLKALPWYSPGAKPSEIAKSVQDLACTTDSIVMTDFSRFDGHIGEFLRVNVEKACYMRWTNSSYKDEFDELFSSELRPKAYLGDEKYKPGCSRLSGSPLTTDGNTLINAFVQYSVLRKSGMGSKEAYSGLGLVCGDDGLQAEFNIQPEFRSRVAKDLGLKLTIDAVAKPGEPVSYLSRVFKDPWTTPASIQDPKRALSKVHVTVDSTVPLDEAGVAKATGYLITDPETPFLSHWLKCYLRNVGDVEPSKTGRDVPYYSLEEFRESPWDTEGGFEEIVADRLGVSAGTLSDHCAELDKYEGSVDDMPTLELEPTAPKVDVVMHGEVHHAGASHSDTRNQNAKQPKQPQKQQSRSSKSSRKVPGDELAKVADRPRERRQRRPADRSSEGSHAARVPTTGSAQTRCHTASVDSTAIGKPARGRRSRAGHHTQGVAGSASTGGSGRRPVARVYTTPKGEKPSRER